MKTKSETVECKFTLEAGRTKIRVECTYEHIERTEREKYQMQMPGNDETVTMAHGPESTEVTHEQIMLEIVVAVGDETQSLTIGAVDFQSIVDAVAKVLPHDPEFGYLPTGGPMRRRVTAA